MSVLGNKTILDPQTSDTLAALKLDIFRTMNCVKLGEIESFDATKKTAQIKILFKRVLPSGDIADYPVLVDCPVVTYQGGGGALQFPVAQGDQCLLFFADRNIDAWFKNGAQAAPLSSRAHDLSDGIALVGINALTSILPDYDDNVNLLVPASKKFVISGGAAVEALGTSLLALKTDVDNLLTFVNQIVTAFNAHVHTSAAPGNPTTVPTVPFVTTPPVVVGTTKLKGS